MVDSGYLVDDYNMNMNMNMITAVSNCTG